MEKVTHWSLKSLACLRATLIDSLSSLSSAISTSISASQHSRI